MLLEGQVQPAFHEAGEEIADHGKGRDQSSDLPSKTHQRRADGRRQHGHHDAADGFRGSEYGLAIDKESAAVERAGKRSSEELLGDDSRPVGHDQQDQQLQQQRALHNGAQ